MIARVASVLLCMMVLVGASPAQTLHKCVTNGVASYQQIPCQGKAAAAPLMGGSHVVAPTAIEGTWKIDRNTIRLPTKAIDLLVQDGKFQCKSCDPPFAVKADGSDQAIPGQPASNTIAVKILDPRSIQQTRKKYGRVVSVQTMTVSVDWQSATLTNSNHTLTATENSTINLARAGIGPATSHEVSGAWKQTGVADMADAMLLFTYQVQGKMVSKSTPSDETYTASLDGTPATSDDGFETRSLSIKAIGNNTLEETSKRNGKVVEVKTLVVAPNGKSMTITDKNQADGTTSSMVAIRQ
jgi:hypothetical protein